MICDLVPQMHTVIILVISSVIDIWYRICYRGRGRGYAQYKSNAWDGGCNAHADRPDENNRLANSKV